MLKLILTSFNGTPTKNFNGSLIRGGRDCSNPNCGTVYKTSDLDASMRAMAGETKKKAGEVLDWVLD